MKSRTLLPVDPAVFTLGTVVKLGYEPELSIENALALAVKALWHAADEDSATGGPDPVRGIYPNTGSHYRRRFPTTH